MKNLLIHADKKRWEQLVDDVLLATGVRGLFKKKHITTIVIENANGIAVRFVPKEKEK